MNTGKKVVLGIIIVIVGFFGIGIAAAGIWIQVDPEGYEQSKLDREAEEKAESKSQEQENRLPSDVFHIIPSKMGNGWGQSDQQEAYYDLSEKLLSEFLLTYQGKDNVGLQMQEAMLVTLINICDAGVMFEKPNTETYAYISDWDDDKITMAMTTSSDLSCTNTPVYYFDIYPKTGKIITDYDISEGMLDFLDKFN